MNSICLFKNEILTRYKHTLNIFHVAKLRLKYIN